jgi:hypothetical protein
MRHPIIVGIAATVLLVQSHPTIDPNSADLQKAAILFDRQGNKKLYQVAINQIKQIQASNAGEF